VLLVGKLLQPRERRGDDEVSSGLDEVLHRVEAIWSGGSNVAVRGRGKQATDRPPFRPLRVPDLTKRLRQAADEVCQEHNIKLAQRLVYTWIGRGWHVTFGWRARR
jgi:hypothetical protein